TKLSALSYSQVVGANDRVRMAISGCGGRGGELMKSFGEIPNVEISHLIDPDKNRVESMSKRVQEAHKNSPQTFADVRKALEDKNFDAIAVSSCNHWHSLTTIWACQAGKDVYVEKPCSQRLFEGRKCIEAAEKYKRLVQHGTQRRSESAWAKTIAAIQQNKFGKLTAAKVYCNRPRGPLGFKPLSDAPANLDWNLWTGPAAETPYHANLAPYNWHWFWNTGNGEIGNNGVHYFDLCRWAMQVKHPDSVCSFGTRFVKDAAANYKDQAETPNIHFVLYDFGGIPLIYESCNIAGPRPQWEPREEAEFYTEQGVLRGLKFYPYKNKETLELEATPIDLKVDDFAAPTPGGPFGSFVHNLRNRSSAKLNAPISEGHLSASVCHWGNAAYRAGEKNEATPMPKIRETIGNNVVLQQSIDKVLANVLSQLPEVTLEQIPFRMGPKLAIDKEKEKFVDNSVVDQFLTRPPRGEFAIPDAV
ncbi:MAG: Gfo/Idh/MocA family protein, partial [Thermoguttaceae bacterium]